VPSVVTLLFRRIKGVTHALYTPSSNFSSPLSHPPSLKPHRPKNSSKWISGHSVEHSTSLLQSTLSDSSRRSRQRPGFAPVARCTSSATLRSCFRPGKCLGFSLGRFVCLYHRNGANLECCLPSRACSFSAQVLSTWITRFHHFSKNSEW